jgi:cysteine desulfuration protein SufE
MTPVNEIEKQLIDDFNLLDTWEERYDYLIELGQNLPEMPDALKTDLNLVRGCQSSVWFDIRCEQGRLWFQADSDSLIVKGMVAILTQVLNGRPASEVLQFDLTLFETLGLWRHLSSQRTNGLTAMVTHLKAAAAGCVEPGPAL